MKPTRMNHLNWSRSAGIALTATVVTVCGPAARAADWVGGTSNDWNTGSNWTGGTVPNAGTDWANIFSGPGNVPVISADSTGSPVAIGIGGNSRLDQTAGILTGTASDWPGGSMLLGMYGSGGIYNLANTGTTGGSFTGYGTGSGSYITGAGGDIRVGSGWWWDHSTAVMNVNTSGTLQINSHLAIAGKNGDNGTVNIDAGTVIVKGGWQTSSEIASGSGIETSTGSLNMSGGTVTLDNRLSMGEGTRAGAGTEGDPYIYANGSNVATLTITGGTLTTDAAHDEGWHGGFYMATGYNGAIGGSATVNLNGGTLSGVEVSMASGDGGTGGSATINLNGGTLSTRNVFSAPWGGGTRGTSTFNFNGGTLKALDNHDVPWAQFIGGDNALTHAYVKAGGAVIDTNGFNSWIGQSLEGDIVSTGGGLTKKGAGTLTLAGTNTYTGNTTVNEGTLSLSNPYLNDASTIRIAAAAILDLNTGGATDTVDKLYFGAAQQAAGTWGSTASGATHQDDAHFAGTGILSVTTAPVAGYTSWANANGATGQTVDQDHDGDGVKNGVEYFMGQTGSTFTANPAAVGDSVTWPMGASYTGVYGTDYEVQYSTNLVTWIQAPIGSGDNTVIVNPGPTPARSVVYNMPIGGKSFVRLVVKN